MGRVTWLDRAIGSVAPRTALRRVQARDSLDALARGYDGAAKGRRTDGWRSAGTSADSEIGTAGALLRDRMRDLVRNNPHAAKAVSVLVNNIIGSGIIARAASGNAKLDAQATALWEAWSVRCDADGQLDFLGIQTLACRQMVEAGEVLIRRRPRRASDGLDVPLQLQLLEADMLDASRNGDLVELFRRPGEDVQVAVCHRIERSRAHSPTRGHAGNRTNPRMSRTSPRPSVRRYSYSHRGPATHDPVHCARSRAGPAAPETA